MVNNLLNTDITPFIVEAIISNKKIENDINNLYEKHKYRAYELAKNNRFYTHQILSDGGISREVYAKRTLGLLLLTKDNSEVCDKLHSIIVKGWRHLHNYCYYKDIVDLKEIIERYTGPNLSDDEFNAILTISLIFATKYGKKVIPDDLLSKVLESYVLRLRHYDDNFHRFFYGNLLKDRALLDKGISIKNRFLDNYKSLKYVHDLFHPDDEYLKLFADHLCMIFDTEDMMFASMLDDNIRIDEKDIIELGALYFLLNKNQNRIESAKFIIYGLLLKYTIKAYKDVKNFYFKNNKETMYFHMEKQDRFLSELKVKNHSLKNQLKALKAENNRLRTEYKNNLERENVLLHKEIEKLKLVIEELEKDKKELLALRDIVLKEEKNTPVEIPQDIVIPPINGIIAGGHSSWHDKLKEVLPESFKYLEGNDNNFDINILNNADYVFIYTKFMGHGFYYRLINKCKNIDANILYINSTSPEYVKKEIYNYINKKHWLYCVYNIVNAFVYY